MSRAANKTVLWWGKSDVNYSRNRICRQALQALGYDIIDFNPLISQLAHLQANITGLAKPDLVWVPCFRQRDIAAARTWSAQHGVPLLLDPLISAWDKQVFERRKFSPESKQAMRLKTWESNLIQSADMVLVDTPLHAGLFARELGVQADKLVTVYVGAEAEMFKPLAKLTEAEPIEVLFYGSFIGLHGVHAIVEAAKLAQAQSNVVWTLLGDGPQKASCMASAEGYENIRFEAALPYAKLPQRIANADILLGVFGGTAKAGNVIPNKVFQALACAKPVITRTSQAYPSALQEGSRGLQFVTADNPQALYEAVMRWVAQLHQLKAHGDSAYQLYERYFSSAQIQQQLAQALSKIVQ